MPYTVTVDRLDVCNVDLAEHVAVIRSIECVIMPHIIDRIASNKKTH